MSVKHNRGHKLVLSALTAPVIIVVLAILLAWAVADRFHIEQTDRFKRDAENTLLVTTANLDNYRDLLYAGRAFALSSDTVTNAEWRSFYNQQAIFERYPGVSSVSYVSNVTSDELPSFEVMLKTGDYFGATFMLKPQSDRWEHGITKAYVSQNDLSAVLGMDLLAAQDRYDVYKRAEAKNSIVSSPPFKLATGYDGFFSVLPVYSGNVVDGYVLTSFRFEDLMKRLFSDRSYGYRVTDVTDSPKSVYSAGYNSQHNHLSQTLMVGDRSWRVDISQKAPRRPLGDLLPAAIIVTSLILATTLYAYSTRPRTRIVSRR